MYLEHVRDEPGYHSVAIAILERAVQDVFITKDIFCDTKRTINEKELKEFFSSDWFLSLCDYLDIASDKILKKLNL